MKVYVLLVCWLCMVTWIPRCDGGGLNKPSCLETSGATLRARKRNKLNKLFRNPFGGIKNTEVIPQDVSVTLLVDEAAIQSETRQTKIPTKIPAQRQGRPAQIPAECQESRQAPKSERKPAATRTETKMSTSKTRPRKPKRQPTRNNRPAAIRNQEAQNTAPKPRTAVSQQIKRQQPIVSSSSRQQVRPKTNPAIKSSIQDERKPLSIPPQKNRNTAQQSQPTKQTPQRSSSFINPSKPAAKDSRPKPKPRPQSRKCRQFQKAVYKTIEQRSQFDLLVLTGALNLFKDVEECRNPEFSRYLQELLDYRSARFGI